MDTFQTQAVQKNRELMRKNKPETGYNTIMAFASLGVLVVGAVVALAALMTYLT